MKRLVTLVLFLGALVLVAGVVAERAAAEKAKPRSVTLQGEIVDMGCYIGSGARGEKHKSCAAKCVAGGMPMGLLTTKNKLYLLTLNHDDAEPFNHSKEMVGSTVEVSGTVSQRGGISAIDVISVKELAPAAGK